MNEDPTPTAPAPHGEDGSHPGNESDPPSEDTRSHAESSRRQRRRRRANKRHNSALSKKLEFMTHLLTNLDQLFFAEVAALYYLELSLLAMDIFILALQALMLAVHSQREALRGAVKPNRGSIDFLPELRRQIRAQTSRTGDQRTQRRQRNRSGSTASQNPPDVEMGLGISSDEAMHGDRDDETTRLITEQPTPANSGQQLSEIYASGNAVVGDFHLVQSMRLASTGYTAAAAHSIRTLGYTASLATLLTSRESERSIRPSRRSVRGRDRG
ncbi:unnamed protein product [Parascedosporium putredinis]|uniref:DUF1746 domain-containing protein n=1 Tax=Parascedosporium putredinis TaxID=1442378 RepID=A0A9P1H5N6_9PEZI|nr:unnamed protein product [Parascedosporium putredinis]CAI7998092.1 unnamed protein product [Parascedosporium putredinis]